VIGQRKLHDFQRGVGGDEHRQHALDVFDAMSEARITQAMRDLILLVWMHDRLVGSRPVDIPLKVTDVEVLPPIVLDQILEGTGDAILPGIVAPTVARPGLRDHQAVIAVADDITPRARRKRGGDDVFPSVCRKVSILAFEDLAHRILLKMTTLLFNENRLSYLY